MKKYLFLTLMLLAATSILRAQDEQWVTEPPTICIIIDDNRTSCEVIFENSDSNPDATIYFAINSDSEWMIYNEPIRVTGAGTYSVYAFAQAPGCEASVVVVKVFELQEVPADIEYLYNFYVDGIYYMRNGDSDVWVTTEAFVWDPVYPNPQPLSYCYSGDLIIPESVEYEGDTYIVTGIYNEALMGCDITSLVLPSTMAEILYLNFYSTPNLKKIVSKAIIPPALSDDYNMVENYAILFVPNESLEAYRAHEAWGRFSRIVPFIGAGPGDVNGDGSISVGDATYLIDQLLSGGELPAWMDVNGDGNVSIKDITDLIDILLGSN